MLRTAKTPEQLHSGADELHYSFEMLHNCAMLLDESEIQDELLRNAVLESFLVHARELIKFFYPGRSDPDTDVMATDFIDASATWTPSKNFSYWEDEKARIDKRLAHMSYLRTTLDAEWQVNRIYGDLCELRDDFLKIAGKTKLAPKFGTPFPVLMVMKDVAYTTAGGGSVSIYKAGLP